MSEDESMTSQPDEVYERGGTTSEDYSGCYFASHLGGEDYGWESEEWRGFFTTVADRVIAATNPRTVLDVGCAKGLLVQALAAAGVDASGYDLSEHAIAASHPDVRDRLRVASAADPIEGRYDLISCVEVLEHLSAADADRAIDNMVAATDRILFSSSPGDFAEPTHINVRPTADWVAAFAERGFFRRTDVNLEFLTPWSVLFERSEPTARDLVHRYETLYAPLQAEVIGKRAALLQAHRDISALQEQQRSDTDAEAIAARHDLLTHRDHVIGLEAEAAAMANEVNRLMHRLKMVKERNQEIREKVTTQRKRAERLERELAAARNEAAPAPRKGGLRGKLGG